MKDEKLAVKRVLPILVFILALMFRQAPPELLADQKSISPSVLQEVNTTSVTQGLGWIQWMDQDDSKELPPVFQPFQNEEQYHDDRLIPLDFTFFFHDRSNPLLTDRPPPLITA
jgi:hypothetical protein